MSRGPGAVQRYILEQTGRTVLIPVPFLAFGYTTEQRITDTPHLRASFRRAALAMIRSGHLDGYRVTLTLRPHLPGTRRVLCVAPAGVKVTEADVEHAQGLMWGSRAAYIAAALRLARG